MNTKKTIFSVIIIILFLGAGYFLSEKDKSESYIQIGGQKVEVKVVDTKEEQELGLSGHPGLEENEGMLFVFGLSEKHGFWMKDMNFAIDMIWIGEDMKIVYIKKNATPESYPEIFIPTQNAKYVLEVVAGFSEKNNVKVGDQLEMNL